MDQGLLVFEPSWAHSVGLLWASDQQYVVGLTWQNSALTRQYIHASMGLEPAISAGERPQIYVLDRTATPTGTSACYGA